MLKLVNFHRCPLYLNLTFINLYFRTGQREPYSISKLSAKYQFCAIHTADNTDGKVTGGGIIFHGGIEIVTTPAWEAGWFYFGQQP